MHKIKLFLIGIGFFLSFQVLSQETYTMGNTEYYLNKTYSTTGKPMVKRSQANKAAFLRQKGYSSTPYGYEIDHIVPLSQGGTDDSSNMQLLTKQQHARKTARERASRSNSTYSNFPKYNSSFTYTRSNNFSSSSSSTKTIYTGKNGGKYYINSNGNKTYVKTTKKPSRSNQGFSTPSYFTGSSRIIHTGSRGGKYYINSNGNKTYVKK